MRDDSGQIETSLTEVSLLKMKRFRNQNFVYCLVDGTVKPKSTRLLKKCLQGVLVMGVKELL